MDSMPSGSQEQSKLWMIASVVLFVALIAVIAFFVSTKGLPTGSGTSGPVLKSDTAANNLVDFINKIYAQQVGTATLKSVTEENGLYKVTVGITANGQPVDQEVYVTRDGELFIPQVIKVDEVTAQYDQFQQQQQAAPTDTNTNTATDTATNTNDSANINAAE
jgi:hypothetical protein